VRACLHFDDAGIPAAVAALERALRQDGSERLRRPFLDAPPQLRPLLRRQPRRAAGAAWLNPSAPPAPPPRRPSGVAIPSVRLAAATPLV
jgi:LuxR family transcriptional regulator, maltose regulon positive regulatory protein